MSRLSAAVGFGLVLLMAVGTARADDGWNPFKERDQARRSERTSAPRPHEPMRESPPPPMPPMEGVGSKPWLDDRAPSKSSMSGYTGPAAQHHPDEQRSAPWRDAPGSFAASPAERDGDESVQRSELQPLPPATGEAAPTTVSADGASPSVFWQGLDGAAISEMIAPLSIPPRSAALAGLWHRLWSSRNDPPTAARSGDPSDTASFDAVRMEALYRSGLIAELEKVMAARQPNPNDPVESLLIARTRIGLGDREPGCTAVKGLQSAQATLPKPARTEFILLAALCGVGEGDASKASLAAELLRAEGIAEALPLASLDALASGNPSSFQMPATKSVSLLDYRFLELVNAEPDLASAEPALLATLAARSKSPQLRILAAEAALALHTIQPADLAAAYRSPTFSADALAQPFAEHQAPPLQRALLFKAFESERTPLKMARLARALLDEVRRADGPYVDVAALLTARTAELRPTPDMAWFAETAIEINLAGHRIDTVRDWVSAPAATHAGRHEDWLVLADIAAASWRGQRGEYLPAVEGRALRGELPPELMHRLVTVLDALDYQIPIPLWEAASRTQQPTGGFLPEMGVLSQLQKASQQREQARVALLAMRTLGPESGATAHMIALGDTIRSLKRVGLEAEARQLGLEALFMSWPRSRSD